MDAQIPKPTPGPWTAGWSKYEDGTFIVQAGMPSNRVLARFDGDGEGPDDQSVADAYLIAAAPDLKAALRELLIIAGMPITERQEEIFRRARSAISKAEGRGV